MLLQEVELPDTFHELPKRAKAFALFCGKPRTAAVPAWRNSLGSASLALSPKFFTSQQESYA